MAMSPENELIGRNVRQIRRLQSLTQQQLAEKAGLSLDFIGGIERGVQSPSIASLARIARALRVEFHELFTTRAENVGDEFDLVLDDIVNLLKGHARIEDLQFIRESIRTALKVYENPPGDPSR